jgi:glutathione peroxidase
MCSSRIAQNCETLYLAVNRTLPFVLTAGYPLAPFAEFLVDKTGKCVKRYAPTDSPLSIVKDIEKYL